MNWTQWIAPFGVVCLGLSWLIKKSDERQTRKRNEHIWAMLPKDVKDAYDHEK